MHACVVGVGGGVGVSATHIRHHRVLPRPWNPYAIRCSGWGVVGDEIRRALDGGASVHYRDLVGLQTWQPAVRSGNPRRVVVTGVCGDEWWAVGNEISLEPLCAQVG